MFDVLYADGRFLVVQSHAGRFDKQGDELYGEYNMGLHVGDNPAKVLYNRASFLCALNALTTQKIERLHWVNQVHGNDVVVADLHGVLPISADALVSTRRGVGLAIMTADCVPVTLFGGEGDGRYVACIHAGWQGLTNGVIKNAFQALNNPTNMQAVIAGCISQKNYEIDVTLAHRIVDEVMDKRLVDVGKSDLFKMIVQDGHDDKCRIDIVALTMLQLERLGVKVLTQSVLDVPCSYHEPKLYSYRQQTHAKKLATGRMATVVVAL